MVNGTIVAPLLVGDGTPLVVPVIPELNEVVPDVEDSEAAVEDSAVLEGAVIEGVGLDGNEFEDVAFGAAELESPPEGEGLEAPDGTAFVPPEVAKRLLDRPVPPDGNVGGIVTLFSSLA